MPSSLQWAGVPWQLNPLADATVAAQYETGVVVPDILHYLIYGSIGVRIVIFALGEIALRPS